MEYYKNILCVSFDELTADVIKADTLFKNVYRKNIECVRPGGGEGNYALYSWDSIPAKYKAKYVERYGDPEVKMKQEMVEKSVRIDAKAQEFYANYTYDAKGEQVHLSEKLINEYTLNASVLRILQNKYSECKSLRLSLGIKMDGVWDVVMQSCEKMRETYNHTLPCNTARLKAKMKDFKEEGYACLISGKLGNANTIKITDDFKQLLVALKRSRVPVYNDSQLFVRANEIATERGWKQLKSLSGLKKWLNSPEIEPLWYDAVYGEQAARQRYGRKHKTALPTRRDSLWYGDGTKLNLYYRDEDGKVRTTMVYEVVDAMSEVLLGYHIADSEDYEAQFHALRMAIQTSRHKPYEFVHDNQGGHKKLTGEGLFGKVATIHRPTMPYNGESKTIENIFWRIQKDVLHKDWGFTGQNVTAKKLSSRPNIEFVSENKDELYTLAELKEAYAKARQEWNEMPHPITGERRIDMYMNSVNEETQEVTLRDMVEMFWTFTSKPVTFTDQGITLTIKKKKYQYEVMAAPGIPDHEWRKKHTYERFYIAYDPYDLSSIRLYSIAPDGSKRFEKVAEPYIVLARAQQDQTEADKKFIRQEQQANLKDRIDRQVAGREMELLEGMAPEQHGLKSPRMRGVSKDVHEEVEKQLEKRITRYKKDPAGFELGTQTKEVSMQDWLDVEENKGEYVIQPISQRKTAGKM